MWVVFFFNLIGYESNCRCTVGRNLPYPVHCMKQIWVSEASAQGQNTRQILQAVKIEVFSLRCQKADWELLSAACFWWEDALTEKDE